ncbi:PTS system mannose/fructose/N-acetylgalactosamine-transporter subunit IIB [Tannockella kyphosi]|uniref:PTS system mannose/fructose/N-acetylgalactosamine-transporter subunit IIB n=1 Tax=Tannockella kyphosi TaxID=2899121 RepID=UPI002010E44C|nr:PTS sugar transporter subunit IIB [Tannockella kyphosi]
MALSLVRIDDRLIHGQVVVLWTKVRVGDAIILVVDDKFFEDSFLTEIFTEAGNALGKKVYIFGVDEAVEKIPKAIEGKKNYYLVAKKVEQLYELKKRGVDFGNEIIFGTASKAPNTIRAYNNVYLSEKDVEYCEYLDSQNIELKFKLTPDEKGLNWAEAKKVYEGGK